MTSPDARGPGDAAEPAAEPDANRSRHGAVARYGG